MGVIDIDTVLKRRTHLYDRHSQNLRGGITIEGMGKKQSYNGEGPGETGCRIERAANVPYIRDRREAQNREWDRRNGRRVRTTGRWDVSEEGRRYCRSLISVESQFGTRRFNLEAK